jgi:hypothetical protein
MAPPVFFHSGGKMAGRNPHSRGGVSIRIATDMDDVLTHMSPVWYSKLWRDRKRFGKHMHLAEQLTEKQVMHREEYYIDAWLKKEEALDPEVHAAYMALYKEKDFYQLCKPTNQARALLGISTQPWCEKIWVFTHTLKGMEETKRDWLEQHMPSTKIELICVPMEMPKSEAINSVGADYTTFIDDSPRVLEDVMHNTLSEGVEILVPALGWNTNHPGVLAAAAKNLSQLIYYSPWE